MTSAIDPTKPTAHIAFTADVRNNFQIAHDEITALQNFAVGPANPTAMVGPVAIPGSAGTFMRSDAAPALANTAVTAGSYTYATLTVDAQGRLTAASSGATPITGNQTITLSGDVGGSGATSIATTVTGLQNRPVATTAPTTNQLLQWTGTAWSPATVATSANVFVGDTAPGSPVAGQFWWNSSAGDGQLYLYYNDGTSSQWVVANNPGSGIYLPLVGGQINPGGLLVGTAGSVPGQGALTLNANTVAPPAGLTANAYVVGADGGSTAVALDQFGSAGNPNIQFRKARGTAAAPTALQAGDVLGYLIYNGRGTTSYSGQANIGLAASENWTDTARGTTFYIGTTPAGGTASVNSLILAGNTATFSGAVSLPTNGSLYLNGATSGGAGRIFSSSGYLFLVAAGANGFDFQDQASTLNLLLLDATGNLTINGATAIKASGTVWANPSSRDIKQDIQPYSQGLEAILALHPVTYRFDEDSGFSTTETHVGLIHDETAHMPEMHRKAFAGRTPDKPGREVDALDCSAVTWALCNAIKELAARLEKLEGAK